jgi:cardiolipin synthase
LRDWVIWGGLLTALSVSLTVGVTVHAVLWKRDSRAVIAWVGLAWLAPLVGSCAYLLLGINRIQRKAVALDLHDVSLFNREQQLSAAELSRIEAFARDNANLRGLAQAGKILSGVALVPGNTIEPLIDGDQAYPAMIAAIDKATRSVALMSYIFDSDRAGQAFMDALVRAQQRNVEVRVLVDGVGSNYSKPNMVSRLQKAGVKSCAFLPTRAPRLQANANLRNHRKILVVDGELGFTGGTNIREGHQLKLDPVEPVQCLHFKLQGPVVNQMQRVFALDWAFAATEVLSGASWFPELNGRGRVWARGIEHGPDENFEKLADLIAAALASARTRVRIVTPYFLPSASLVQALNVTAMRGVDVEIYLPSVNNIALVQWATTAQLWQVLERGIRVYATNPPFDHSKLMLVDDIWALIGSSNWDPRSLRLNFEFNVECYDEALAASLNRIVDHKAEFARRVTMEDVNARSYPVKLRDGLARLLTPYL